MQEMSLYDLDELEAVITSLVGQELRFSVSASSVILDVKRKVQDEWDLPVMEQRLLIDGQVATDQDVLASLSDGDQICILLLRCPPYQFDRKLMHKNAHVSEDGSEIVHGGQDEYQAAFLSGILQRGEIYRVKVDLEDAAREDFAEMFVGIAPDCNRCWSNLKGSYVNRKGIYEDGFSAVNWRNIGWMGQSNLRSLFGARGSKCSFVLEIDLTTGTLSVYTLEGDAVTSVDVPEMLCEPIRLCATLGYPHQRVSVGVAEDPRIVKAERLQAEAEEEQRWLDLMGLVVDGSIDASDAETAWAAQTNDPAAYSRL